MRVWAALCLLLMCGPAVAGGRKALLVGNRIGSEEQAPLRFTSEDVRRLAAVLTELGGVDPGNLGRIEDASAAEVLERLDALAHEKGERPEIFFFFYSGHADGSGLQLAGTTLPMAVLLEKIAAVPAGLRIIILDACQSGSAIRAKGVHVAAPWQVHVEKSSPTGDIIISSSAATEQSYESDAYRAAIFSLHLTSALRGAADADADGSVTLSEAYRHAYAQTLRSTLLTSGGPQRPTFRWELQGNREPILTRLNASARLTLHAADEGDFILFDDEEQRVFAEVRVERGRQARLALSPGTYVVKKRGTRDLRSARIRLSPNDDRVLVDAQMPATPLIRLARKGSFGDVFITGSAGQYWSAFGERGQLQLSIGPEWERSHWLFGAQLVVSVGAQEHRELVTPQQSVGLLLSALAGHRIENMVLRLGPAVGVQHIRQQPEGRADRAGFAVRAGPRLRLDAELTSNVGLFATLDGQVMATPAEGTFPGFSTSIGSWGLFGSVGYSVGIVAVW